MRLTAFSTVFTMVLFSAKLQAQDKIILLNGEVLVGKITAESTDSFFFMESDVNREISSKVVQKVVKAGGQELDMVSPFTMGLAYDETMAVLGYSASLENDIEHIFNRAVRRVFRAPIEEHAGLVTRELFTNQFRKESELNWAQARMVKKFRLLGYACHAFLATVSVEEKACTYIFYSNPIPADTITNAILHKSFHLVDSKASRRVRDFIDEAIKPFTLRFEENEDCGFKEADRDEKIIKYSVNQDGTISFWDPGKKDRAIVYDVVEIRDDFVRYTLFNVRDDVLVTRKIQRVSQ